MPPPTGLGPLQAPPACGAPPSCANKEVVAAFAQMVNEPFVPAFVVAFSVTVTVAVAFGHGAVPVTVYT